jgi:hypothetical protein
MEFVERKRWDGALLICIVDNEPRASLPAHLRYPLQLATRTGFRGKKPIRPSHIFYLPNPRLCTIKECNNTFKSGSGTYVPEGLPGLTIDTTFGICSGSPLLSTFSNQSTKKKKPLCVISHMKSYPMMTIYQYRYTSNVYIPEYN